VARRGERHAGVEDRVAPAGDLLRAVDGLPQNLLGVGEAHALEGRQRVREAAVDALGEAAQRVDLLRVGAELLAPLHAGEVLDQQPPVVVLHPEAAAVVILIGAAAEVEVLGVLHQLVHHLAGDGVGAALLPRGMIRDVDRPRVGFVLRMRAGGSVRPGWSRAGAGSPSATPGRPSSHSCHGQNLRVGGSVMVARVTGGASPCGRDQRCAGGSFWLRSARVPSSASSSTAPRAWR